jgi:hypothetical protein
MGIQQLARSVKIRGQRPIAGWRGYNAEKARLRLGTTILILGVTVAFISIALTVRCYMPCPFGDQWFVIDSIARGNGPSSWSWLFGQHNEHRIAIPRALIWLFLVRFHGKNVSLFVEIYLVLLLHWIAICYALDRFTDFPTALKRTLHGLFALLYFSSESKRKFHLAF